MGKKYESVLVLTGSSQEETLKSQGYTAALSTRQTPAGYTRYTKTVTVAGAAPPPIDEGELVALFGGLGLGGAAAPPVIPENAAVAALSGSLGGLSLGGRGRRRRQTKRRAHKKRRHTKRR